MSEKKENIKSGLNIDVDGGNVVVLNNVSIAEKIKKANEEQQVAPSIEKPAVSITPDVKITPESSQLNKVEIPTTSLNPTDDFVIPNINSVITPDVPITNVVSPAIPNIPTINPESPMINNNLNNASINGNSSVQFDNLKKENKIFKSTSDVEKLSEEVASEVRKALNEHVVYPMKATTDLLHELYSWGEEVANNGLNRKLLEEYDGLKKKYSDLESVYDVSKTVSNFDNTNNNFNNDFDKKDDDFNNFGGFSGFGRAA